MKKLLLLPFLNLALCLSAFANGASRTQTGTADIDEEFLRSTSPERAEINSREKAMRNQRNGSFPGSLRGVNDREDEIQRMEERPEYNDLLEDDPFIDNDGNGRTTNPPIDQPDPRD